MKNKEYLLNQDFIIKFPLNKIKKELSLNKIIFTQNFSGTLIGLSKKELGTTNVSRLNTQRAPAERALRVNSTATHLTQTRTDTQSPEGPSRRSLTDIDLRSKQKEKNVKLGNALAPGERCVSYGALCTRSGNNNTYGTVYSYKFFKIRHETTLCETDYNTNPLRGNAQSRASSYASIAHEYVANKHVKHISQKDLRSKADYLNKLAHYKKNLEKEGREAILSRNKFSKNFYWNSLYIYSQIFGQLPTKIKAKEPVGAFNIKKGLTTGLYITLRKNNSNFFSFYKFFIYLCLPTIFNTRERSTSAYLLQGREIAERTSMRSGGHWNVGIKSINEIGGLLFTYNYLTQIPYYLTYGISPDFIYRSINNLSKTAQFAQNDPLRARYCEKSRRDGRGAYLDPLLNTLSRKHSVTSNNKSVEPQLGPLIGEGFIRNRKFSLFFYEFIYNWNWKKILKTSQSAFQKFITLRNVLHKKTRSAQKDMHASAQNEVHPTGLRDSFSETKNLQEFHKEINQQLLINWTSFEAPTGRTFFGNKGMSAQNELNNYKMCFANTYGNSLRDAKRPIQNEHTLIDTQRTQILQQYNNKIWDFIKRESQIKSDTQNPAQKESKLRKGAKPRRAYGREATLRSHVHNPAGSHFLKTQSTFQGKLGGHLDFIFSFTKTPSELTNTPLEIREMSPFMKWENSDKYNPKSTKCISQKHFTYGVYEQIIKTLQHIHSREAENKNLIKHETQFLLNYYLIP